MPLTAPPGYWDKLDAQSQQSFATNYPEYITQAGHHHHRCGVIVKEPSFTIQPSQSPLRHLREAPTMPLRPELPNDSDSRRVQSPTKRAKAAKADPAASSKPAAKRNTLFQFKIVLEGSKPPIWRRIQTKDCTLDKLHEHIQTAMGWLNCHLHLFRIDGQIYADPMLMEEDFIAWNCADSTHTRISEILPADGKRFAFSYEYDFGDSWLHEIIFEGCLPATPGGRYPLCLEGERACPPENVGGIGGYAEFLKVLADPGDERHVEWTRWVGPFAPEKFDPNQATRAMRKGLPDDWRYL
jgi:hypothetical protein